MLCSLCSNLRQQVALTIEDVEFCFGFRYIFMCVGAVIVQ